MRYEEICEIVCGVSYRTWNFHVGQDRGHVWLQVRFHGWDATDPLPRTQHGRKWLLSEHMTRSEIVATCFKAVMTAEEHEIRERFKYLGKAIYNPHLDVAELAGIADFIDVRKPQNV